jgi:ribosomal biogenesis protein LAS1
MSIAAIAERIGLPRWLVDVRHETTHMQLPSLAALRLAASQCLDWLNLNYWVSKERHTEQ